MTCPSGDATWAPWARRIRGVLAPDGAWLWWTKNRLAFTSEFQAFADKRSFDSELPENPILPDSSSAAQQGNEGGR